MKEGTPKLLFDFLSAAEAIDEFIAGKTIDDYETDKLLRSAVERQFTIVGEALVRLRNLDPDTAATISELSKIIAFRNIVVHGYDMIEHFTIWDIAQRKLPGLRAHVSRLLGDIPEP